MKDLSPFEHFQANPSPIHRLVSDWPPRYVVYKTNVGWNSCDLCRREHRIWMAADSDWQKLPQSLHDKRICINCFRACAPR